MKATLAQSFRDLRSTQCACGRPKVRMIPFCRTCYDKLSDASKAAMLDQEIPFDASYNSALQHLSLESPAAFQDAAEADAIRSGTADLLIGIAQSEARR